MKQAGNILLTGASGLAGGHIARYFSRHGASVHAMVRPGSDTSFIRDLPVRLVHGDVTDPASLDRLCRGMDTVIHTAARVADWGRYEDFYRVNVIGTLNALEAAAANGIGRAIVLGSVSSYGEEDCQTLKDETCPFRSHYPYAFGRLIPSGMNHYRDTKAEATRLAMSFAEARGMNLTVLEPAWIYGENESNSGFYEYLKLAAAGIPFVPGRRSNTFHVIHAADLARACWLAYLSPPPGAVRIIIGNSSPVNMRHIFGLFCREAGIRQPRCLPKWVIYPVALIMESLFLLLNKPSPPPLTRSRVNMFYDSIGFSTKRAEQLLGFTSRVELETGIRETVKWYRQNQWL